MYAWVSILSKFFVAVGVTVQLIGNICNLPNLFLFRCTKCTFPNKTYVLLYLQILPTQLLLLALIIGSL